MSQGDKQDTLYEAGVGWGIMLIIFAVIGWAFWKYQAQEISNIIRWIRYGEMWLISWFVFSDTYMVPYGDGVASFQEGLEQTPKYTKETLTATHLSYFTALAMQPLKIPLTIFFAVAAYWAYTRGPNTHCREKLGLEEMIKRHAGIFPVVAPFADFNPNSQPPRPPGAPVPAELPLFAEALGPEEWLSYNRVNVPDGIIDRKSTARAFRKQLGKRWKGAKALPPYKQIMLAAFCLKASRKRSESDDMLGRLARCWSSKNGLNLGKDRALLRDAHKVLRNKDLAASTLKAMNQHAFETTAMLRALANAREEGGVLAPAQFVWLRGHDRTLWYPMNNLGRHSFHMEAMGAMSHFKAERRTSRPIPVPKIDDAVDSIAEYMDSDRSRPLPTLDYSGSKKRAVKKAV